MDIASKIKVSTFSIVVILINCSNYANSLKSKICTHNRWFTIPLRSLEVLPINSHYLEEFVRKMSSICRWHQSIIHQTIDNLMNSHL